MFTRARDSLVTGYTVTAAPGGQTCSTGSAPTSCRVIGLANGTSYTFTVTALNEAHASVQRATLGGMGMGFLAD